MNQSPYDFTTADDPTLQKEERSSLKLPALTIISHGQVMRAGQCAFLMRKGVTNLSRLEPDFKTSDATWGEPLADPYISRKPISLKPHKGGVVIDNTAVGKRLKVNGQDCPESIVISKAQLENGVVLELAGRVCLFLHLKEFHKEKTPPVGAIIGESDRVQSLRAQIAKVADVPIPVILLGASGTGKELVAAAIAAGSKGPYVCVNMAAIPANLAASELFGSTRGAFTGADKARAGYFAAAHTGTLFMDEIGELSPEIQPLLLRALENGEIQAVGATESRKVQVRVVAATDANLEELIAQGKFKAPLLHRLSGFVIEMPTLAERREDIGMLFAHFAESALAKVGNSHLLAPEDPYTKPWIPAELAATLLTYHWPGNVRQLRNLTNQLVIMNRDQAVLDMDSLNQKLPHPEQTEKASATAKPIQLSEEQIRSALKENRYDIKATAIELGLSRAALYRRLEKMPDVRKASELSEQELQQVWTSCEGCLDAMVEQLGISAPSLQRRLKELSMC